MKKYLELLTVLPLLLCFSAPALGAIDTNSDLKTHSSLKDLQHVFCRWSSSTSLSLTGAIKEWDGSKWHGVCLYSKASVSSPGQIFLPDFGMDGTAAQK